ncbi:MAG: LysR family transcriptional regulator [Lachnospiraceae bacterium]|nr:LysR family transcriptional regulator [Lachnospiraceae bacterium]
MNFLNLEYFIAAAEEMNFTRASKRLYISQPSLSNHIAKLEEELGVELFDRNPPITLTEAGRSLLHHARRMVEVKKEAELELQDIKDFRSAELTIGVTHIRGTYMLPPLLMRFREAFPRVRVKLMEGTTDEIKEALYRGKVDLTIGYLDDDMDTSRIQSEYLQAEEILLIVGDHILREYFSEREQREILKSSRLPLGTFACCPFIKMKMPSWIGSMFERICRAEGITPEVVLETQNITTMISLGMAGYGIGISPGIFVKQNPINLGRDGGAHTFILDHPEVERTIAANYLKNKYQTKIAKQFIVVAKEVLHQMYEQ